VFRKYLLFTFLILLTCVSAGQVRIRLYASENPSSAALTVRSGSYEIDSFNGFIMNAEAGTTFFISKYNGKIIIKPGFQPAFTCDSLFIRDKEGNGTFSLRAGGRNGRGKVFSGDIRILPELNTLLMINIPEVEAYIAGVVQAEGGSARNIEYYKSQAILARTYLYRNIGKHLSDRFNLCDDTHCQAFDGITGDSLIVAAAQETKGQVILAPDSTLVISAFHSNCGGETSPAEYAWLSGQPYLQSVEDTYCRSSRNASWSLTMSRKQWTDYLSKSGFNEDTANPSTLNFTQEKRVNEYRSGNFTLPFRQIRNDLNLRSAFFSVTAEGDSILLSGRGYGHGVGLCQEGAMVMAEKGFTCLQIIEFYYHGVIISDIKNALVNNTPSR